MTEQTLTQAQTFQLLLSFQQLSDCVKVLSDTVNVLAGRVAVLEERAVMVETPQERMRRVYGERY